MSATELTRMSAATLLARMRARELSAEEVFRAHLDHIGSREPAVGAWVCIDAEAGLRAARALDAGPVRGPLHGLPVGVKDIIDTAELPTEYGSPIYAGHRPAWDAACVAAIRRAGGLILGKTVTTEFASSHPGKTRHPMNGSHTPGGSSSGSAAAVADCMIPAALGTQTGGSIIRPAGFCGIVGFKPGFGLINRHGVKALSESLDTVGVLARNVGDSALFAAVAADRPELEVSPLAAAPRIGIVREHAWGDAHEQAVAVLRWSIERLQDAGATVEGAQLGMNFEHLNHAHHDIEFFDMARALAFEMNVHPERLSGKLRERLEGARQISTETYERQHAFARQARLAIDQASTRFDVLLSFAAPGEAPEGLSGTGNSVFNRVWTLLHLPCVALPMPQGKDAPSDVPRGQSGLPIGIQVIGRRGSDAKTLSVAAWMEAALRE
jgi:amidase